LNIVRRDKAQHDAARSGQRNNQTTAVQRTELVTRDAILKLLTDNEVAKVSSAEGASALTDGAEYLDLEQLDRGVQKAKVSLNVNMGHVIPRNSVSDQTWRRITALMAQ
jgi:hypothetical protein